MGNRENKAGLNRIPGATYRFQFNEAFTLSQAAELVGYLSDLGVSDCYASPLFQAGPGSSHGYDVCDFRRVNPVLGGPEALDLLAARLSEAKLGLLLDMVPNHMGNDLSNPWWLDVLEYGPASRYASWFDINWHPPKSDLHGKVLVPILEDRIGDVLAAGRLKLVCHSGAFSLTYYDKTFPLSPRSYGRLIDAIQRAGESAPGSQELLTSLNPLLTVLHGILLDPAPPNAKFEQLKLHLRKCWTNSAQLRGAVDVALSQLNGRTGEPDSFDQLWAFLDAQHYRLAYWKVGPEEINYRRFFDVTTLVSMRMENPEVFAATHELVFKLIGQGKITGLRIDHPDGLWNPKEYFDRLQEQFATTTQRNPAPKLYVVAEKILSGPETLAANWPVQGTTGYDFLNQLNGIYVDSSNAGAFDGLYREFIGEELDFEKLVRRSKLWILKRSLISELDALANRLKQIATATRDGRDFTFRELRAAIAAVIAAFPVYRSYVTFTTSELPTVEEEWIRRATEEAEAQPENGSPEAVRFIRNLLLLQIPRDLPVERQRECREFVMRFQQLSGPVMAKGLEDTAFYNYNRLVSLNEVGGEPARFGVPVADFHGYNGLRIKRWPHSLSATATHDTKRGEDLRARLNVLSEMPDRWRSTVLNWQAANRHLKRPVSGHPAPTSNDEYLFYQTLVGAWTSGQDQDTLGTRLVAYMEKAVKEAKANTTWTSPNAEYEQALQSFVTGALHNNAFMESFREFHPPINFFGTLNSLSQLLVKLTAPGVPDIYQGTELWDFSLVDPDNRRPVDYPLRKSALAALRNEQPALAPKPQELLLQSDSGHVKMFLLSSTLQFRAQHRPLFDFGDYVPLRCTGSKAKHLCAFARLHGQDAALVLAPRLFFTLAGGKLECPLGAEFWEDTVVEIPTPPKANRWRNLLTHELLEVNNSILPLADALRTFPVALLSPA